MNGDGIKPPEGAEKSLGEIVSEVSEKASLLVREEIELAKAEVTEKMSRLTKGAAIAAAAGVFIVFGVVTLLHGLAWLIDDALNSSAWVGFLIVTGVLFILGIVAGLIAVRMFRRGTPPTPQLAIEEAKRTRHELERQAIARDQVGRTLEKGEG
jgi:uncharacterized membrane protein YqjE